MLTKKDLDRIERSVGAHLGRPVVAYCAWDPHGQAVGVMLRDGDDGGFVRVLSPRLISLDELQAELREIIMSAAQALTRAA